MRAEKDVPFSLHAARLDGTAGYDVGGWFVFGFRGARRDGLGRCGFLVFERRVVFGNEVAHVRFAERAGDAVEADFETRSQARGLLGVLGSEFAGAFGDCGLLDVKVF